MDMHRRGLVAVALLLLLAVAAAGAWLLAHSTGLVTAESLKEILASIRQDRWAPLLVIGLFLVAGAIAFPINLVVLATAAVFGPWLGYAYSVVGVFGSAFLMYFLGARLGRDRLERHFGPRARQVLEATRRRGFLVVLAFRVLPVAPATLVNMGAGASGIRFVDFLLGSILGMGPGLFVVCIIGDRLAGLLENPSAGEAAILAACVALYVALVIGAQTLISRRR